MGVTRTGVINDLHVPFQDHESVMLVLSAFRDAGISRLVINGDLLDFYQVSAYGQSPEIQFTLEDELIAGREFMEMLRDMFPKVEIVYLFGNHEDRLNRYILKNARKFYNLLTVENYLNLERLNIEYYYYNHCYQLEETNLYIQHSPPSYGVNGARTSLLKKMDASFIYGCTHRRQSSSITGHSGEVYTCYFNGWLGSIDATPEHEEVFSYAKGHSNWQKGGSLVVVENKKDFYVTPIDVIKTNGKTKLYLDGHIYEL